MNPVESPTIGRPSEPGEYDDGMQALLQIVWGDGFLSPGGAAEVARLLEGSDITGCSVLDIGCGLGAIDELLVAVYGAATVVGIDVDPSLLETMRARIARARLTDRIRGMQVAAGPLPFADGEFDVVFSKDSLVQIPDKPAIFAEVLRVLRPRASPTTWRLSPRARQACAPPASKASRSATGMIGISRWRCANSKPWRETSTR